MGSSIAAELPGPRNVRAQTQNQLVGSRPDDDLLRRDAAVAGRRLAQLTEGSVRILLQPGEALRQRHLRHAR